MTHRFTNDLIHETSPYLLQHAHNPVNWYPWKPEILEKAEKEDKLIIISIGYAACHWCHVMEEQCFENEEVAKTMNDHFINIKVDREERPDIDHIYMDALQMMTGHGGWPLNIVALPDGRPFWGATYVKKEQWIRILEQIAEIYRKNPKKLVEYAEELTGGLQKINLIENDPSSELLSLEELNGVVTRWHRSFDTKMGGYNRAPKFMMPGNLDFLLHYAIATRDRTIKEYVDITLTKMAYGGVFDHVGGGFARYSVDTKWHVPHFEKMLYDNALLTSVYAKAYGHGKNDLYAEVVDRIIEFAKRELMNDEGGFYSSLDADSLNENGDLEEGAFYVWKKAELEDLLGDDFDLFKDFYNINSYGLWEHGNYVLIQDRPVSEIASKHQLEEEEVKQKIDSSRKILLEEREKRPRPRLDDKILCSWNGLMLKGLTDAYRYLGNDTYLELALKNAEFIEKNFLLDDGRIYHSFKDGNSTISGYLEDYAAVIDGFIGLYEVSFQYKWLQKAKDLTEYCLSNYYDQESGLFYFTSENDDYIIRRTLETGDNVIPSSNSMMYKNLLKLSRLFMDTEYDEKAQLMISQMQERTVKHPESHGNWMHAYLYSTLPYYEVAIVGEGFGDVRAMLQSNYLPNAVFAGTPNEGEIDILKNRYSESKTLIYICLQGTCKLPLEDASEALLQLRPTD